MYGGHRHRVLSHEDNMTLVAVDQNSEHSVSLEKVVTYVQIVNTNGHDSTATFRRFGSGDVLSCFALSVLAPSKGAFASGAGFDFFFTMTPLRGAFVSFFTGADAVFLVVADAGSTAGAGGGVLTITFAATALYQRDTHCEYEITARRIYFCEAYSRKVFSSSPSRSLRSRSSFSWCSLMESRNMISSSSRARNWFASLFFSSHSSCLAA